ncbi:MAG: restriction endonuclease subunit S [Candidatus Udaeobacter sp.]
MSLPFANTSIEPSDWPDGSLLDLCSLVSDQCDPAKTDHEVYVGLEHIDPSAFTISRHGSPKDVVSAKNRFKKDDILYGKLRPYLDKAVLAQEEGICSTDILVFRPREEVCPLFALALIHSKPFLEYAVQTTNGVNHPRTSWAALKDFECSIPPFSEQKKIAAVLWKIQKAVEIEDAIVGNTRDLKKSLLRRLFTHGLRGEPLKETEIGPVPQRWDVVSLARLCMSSAFGPRFSGSLYSTEGGVLTLRTTDLDDDGRIDFSHVPAANLNPEDWSEHLLQPNDCVVSRSGTCGIVAVFEGHEKPVLPGAFLIRVRLNNALLPQFFRYFGNSPNGRAQMEQLAQGAIQKNISGTRLLTFKLPLPCPDEQRQFVDVLRAVDRKIDTHESKKRSLQDLFKTLLHKLMTAEIRVNDLDIDTREIIK